jgi:hypothetical protein
MKAKSEALALANQRRQAPLEVILKEKSSCDRGALKRRLYKEGLKEHQCELCGQGEIWQGQKISLILDHINGIRDDNRLENLRIVCPNCPRTADGTSLENVRDATNGSVCLKGKGIALEPVTIMPLKDNLNSSIEELSDRLIHS